MIALLASLMMAQDLTAKPVPEHEVLKKFEGEWDSVSKFMMEPGKEPAASKGKESCKLIMGGLFLVTDVDSELFGSKFSGHGVTGYCTTKKYTGSWVDSLSTSQYALEGTFEGNVLSLRMEGIEPGTGQPLKMRLIHELKDADHRVMRFFMTYPDGKEHETGSVTYTRRK